MSVTQAALRAGGRLSALLAFFAVAAIAGTLVACVVTPAVAIAGDGAKQQITAFQRLPSSLDITPLDQKTRIYATSHGKRVLLASFFSQNRDVIPWSDVPATVKNATLAAEDIRFYQHGAVDPNGIARALVSNLMHRDIQGASTISQQYVKNVCVQQAEAIVDAKRSRTAYLGCIETTLDRKVREMRLAIGLEKKYEKDEILLGYLNIAGFGGRTYGIEAASQYYYDKHAKDLDIGQAATLISIVNNPDSFRLDVKANLAGAEERRNHVLAVERDHSMITAADYEKYASAPIRTRITPPSTGCQSAGSAGFFCDYVVKSMLYDPAFSALGSTSTVRLANLRTKGWSIDTTLNLDAQRKAQAGMDRYVPKTTSIGDLGGAAVSVQVGTGRVLAMVQNKIYRPVGAKNRTRYSAVNYNVDQQLGAGGGHQPGSTFKAFTLIGWLKSGHTINQKVNGNARKIDFSNFTACGDVLGGKTWDLHNDEKEKGNYTIQLGTAKSINGVFASLAEEQDLCKLRDIAQSMGVRNARGGQLVATNPTMAIGVANSIAPIDMATGYATIANQGVYCATTGVDRVVSAEGKTLVSPTKRCKRVQDKQLMIAAGYDLQNPVTQGTMSYDRFNDGHYLFGKTGTTDDAVDTWTIGSTTKVTTAVWIGNVNGFTNLRHFAEGQGCNAGNLWAYKRHCVFQAIQRVMNATYGGAAAWPYPEQRYLSGGAAIVHDDAKPTEEKKAKKKRSAGGTGGTGTGGTGTGGAGGGKGGTGPNPPTR